LLVSALGHLGDIDEARRIWAELKKVNPKYSFAGHVARLPFNSPADACAFSKLHPSKESW
jgi:adenylate cyclase